MNQNSLKNLTELAKLIRYLILTSTAKAGSGHMTSSMSAVELMTALLFGGIFRYDLKNPKYHNNDRLIFSKGHASPLLYSLFAATGKIKHQELKSYRQFTSRLQGHPTPDFPYTEFATGSLGQGLSIGVGLAINAKYLDKLPYRTYVLIGDGEMAEGSVWGAIQIASHYKLNNLIGVLDVNRLGQSGQTMYGHNLTAYQKRISAFGWQTIVIDGHDFSQIIASYQKAAKTKNKPTMIIAKTIKGKGVAFLENKTGWHAKVLSPVQLTKVLPALGKIDFTLRGEIKKPKEIKLKKIKPKIKAKNYPKINQDLVATRQAYGEALVKIFPANPQIVVLDAEVNDSTYARLFKEAYPKRFFEMFIAEQNMVGVALGLASRGKIPYVSTFGAFFARAFDQIRMAQYSGLTANINFVGSHAGTSIGHDGPSQMGLEDIAMFRTIINSAVLYPADYFSCEKLVSCAIKHPGIVYIRTTRMATPIIYSAREKFELGGSKILAKNKFDKITVVAAGITLHQAIGAVKDLKRQKINVRLIDCYSIKPIDKKTLRQAAKQTGKILTVEDHYVAGGLGEAVKTALEDIPVKIYSLAVEKMPRSGKPDELLANQKIAKEAIVKKVKKIVCKK